MTRCEYLTARCPFGCEAWLHPKAVAPHTSRCRQHPWTDDRQSVSDVLLSEEAADDAQRICPPEILARPEFSEERVLSPRDGMYLRAGLGVGTVVRSPLPGVTGRRWWTVVRAADGAGHPIDAAFSLEGFDLLEQQLELTDFLVRCDVCGDDVKPKGLKRHQSSNSVCRFLTNVAEVRTFWDLGYRDPYRLGGDVPLTWTDLNKRVCWRKRLHTVRFSLWTAVLVSA